MGSTPIVFLSVLVLHVNIALSVRPAKEIEDGSDMFSREYIAVNDTSAADLRTWECSVDENHKDPTACLNSGFVGVNSCHFCPCDGDPGSRGCEVKWNKALSPGTYTGEAHLRIVKEKAFAGGIYQGLCASTSPEYDDLCSSGHWIESHKELSMRDQGPTAADLEKKERKALDRRTKYCITVAEWDNEFPWTMQETGTANLVGPYEVGESRSSSKTSFKEVMFRRVSGGSRGFVSGGCALFPSKRIKDGYFKASERCTSSRGCTGTAFKRNTKLTKNRLMLYCEKDKRCNRPKGWARVGHDYV